MQIWEGRPGVADAILLAEVESALLAAPGDVELLLERSRLLRDLGEDRRAREGYLAILMRERYQCDALLGLADLFLGDGEFESALVVVSQALTRHPESVRALALLGSVLLEQDRLTDARTAFLAAVQLEPANRKAWSGLGVIFERAGDIVSADHAWRAAFGGASPARSRYRGLYEPVRILLLWSAVDGNIPLKPILDDRKFEWSTLFVESFDASIVLPPHDVVFNAVGNADLRTRSLAMAERTLAATGAPVINHPARVRTTGRVAVGERLRGVPDVVVPRMTLVTREVLLAPDAAAFLAGAGFDWPLLVRSLGYHTGENFVRVADPTALREAVAALPGEELLVIAFVETRRSDGVARKYRVLTIDGRLYPLHLAISPDWKIHYFTADARPEHRAEERAFLEDMPAVLGERAMRALERIAGLLALDYGGIDFTLDAAGNIVVFEANATMAIVPPGTGEDEAYRREPIRTAIEAVQALIAGRAQLHARPIQ